jgi:SagB-type dehydrogenase family enzyme
VTDHSSTNEPPSPVSLPAPKVVGPLSLEALLQRRRSCRDFIPAELTLAQAGQLLWATQGITQPQVGRRTVPSAGARYPLELSLVASRVQGLAPGLYRYRPAGHTLELVRPGDLRPELARRCADQTWMAEAGLILTISAVFERTMARYGARGRRYVHLDAGIAVQNACLQATSLGLGSVVVGAFDDAAVAEVLELPVEQEPLLLLPVGRPA